MKRLVVVLAMLFAGSCAKNTMSFVISENAIPDPTTCIAPAGAGGDFRGAGVLDLKFYRDYPDLNLPGYLIYPVVTNNLTDMVLGQQVGGTDLTIYTIEITRMDITLVNGTTGAILGQPFAVPFFKTILAASSASGSIEAIPRSMINTLSVANSPVIIKATFVGNRNGSEIRSNELELGVRICDGCLINDLGACVAFTGTASYNTCNLAQDVRADCCDADDGSLICPAVTATAPDGGTPTDGGTD
jgi:hypothetical protein